jgi:hypothetical protein
MLVAIATNSNLQFERNDSKAFSEGSKTESFHKGKEENLFPLLLTEASMQQYNFIKCRMYTENLMNS